MRFIPKTRLGKYSIWLIITMPIFFIMGMLFVNFYEGVSAGSTILQDIATRPGVALSMLAGFFCGVSAFVVGITSIIKNKDFAVFVFISTTLGFLTLLWVIAEFAFPH